MAACAMRMVEIGGGIVIARALGLIREAPERLRRAELALDVLRRGAAQHLRVELRLVDPVDPSASVDEIKRTKEMGSVAVMLLGVTGDIRIDDPAMEPIWAAAKGSTPRAA